MKPIVTTFAAALIAATPAFAQEERSPSENFREGAEKMGEALDQFLEGLSKEMEPLAESWREFLDDLGDLNQYEAPERLPNGDIIIRRKTPLPPELDIEESPDATEL